MAQEHGPRTPRPRQPSSASLGPRSSSRGSAPRGSSGGGSAGSSPTFTVASPNGSGRGPFRHPLGEQQGPQ
eukprot:9464762-Pyramimonas_sp.AAC.1